MRSTVEDAQKVLADLEGKLIAAKAATAEIADAAKQVSFDAHTGDAAARKKLDDLNKQGVTAGLEIQSLEIAVSTARCKLADARADADDEVAKEQARHALGSLDDFAKRGDEFHVTLDKFIAKYVELTHDFRELEKLGFAPTSFALIKINMQAAVATTLQFTDLRQAFLAPHERRDLRAVIEGWAGHIRAKAQARIGNAKKVA